MLLLVLLLRFSPAVLGQLGAAQPADDLDLADLDNLDLDFDFGIASRRVPRQVKAIIAKDPRPVVQELSIQTTIVSRYAFTAVSCAMLNRRSAAAEAVFQFQMPANAFVTNFTMIIGGRVYQSQVRPREKKVKSERGRGRDKESGEPGTEPEMELFKMAATIPGRNRAVFLLTYEELLRRRLGRYEHVTSLRPRQLVSRLALDVTIADHSPITQLEVLPLRSPRASGRAGLPVTTAIRREKNTCRVTFGPNIVQQARMAADGLLGDFVIRYEVQRDLGVGDLQVLNGHFVHYFAPKDLPAVPKNVVFVIDTSASMLGKKMRQTKEALFTILGDLRPGDHFNFISFSNRIKAWRPGGLVPVTPEHVRDAKKFIVMLPTTGGTDIDGAVQTGASLLRGFLSGRDASPNSVSLVIFLTDGRPTVGEVRPAAILGNARAAVQDKFCIFTVGIGDDVDYRLLERMALDNCGMMRRIPEEVDASAMLKGFYEEIGTPLLSDIRINYTQDSVQYVTRHRFANYFNGSEMVVAGKLSDRSGPSLRVQVTASSSDKSVVLETDVPLPRRQAETEKHLAAAVAAAGPPGSALGAALGSILEGFAERVWGFLSVKEGLRSRLRSRTGQEREKHIRQVTALSLAYNFLTPLTNLVVERPGGGLASHAVSNEVPGGLEGAGSRPLTPSATAGPGDRSPAKESVTVSKTSADGDPHFLVEFPLSKLTVCFNINGEPGDILRLVSDHEASGVTVNGKLIGAPAPPGSRKRQRTYFGTITVVVDRPRRAYIEVTPKKVILDGRDRMVLPCHSTATVDSGGLSVSIAARTNVTVSVGGNISFVVLLHQYRNPAPYQRDHLGFYIGQSKGLSPRCHGLLGQFLHQEVGLARLPPGEATPSAALKVKGRSVPVVQKSRRIYGGSRSVDCWFARNNAAKLIDGQYRDYLRSHLFATGGRARGSNGA